MIGQPVQRAGTDGELTVEPNIAVAANREPTQVASSSDIAAAGDQHAASCTAASRDAGPMLEQRVTPTFEDPFAESLESATYFERPSVQRLGESMLQYLRSNPWQRPFYSTQRDQGLGHERVMFAPSEIDISQPLNNLRIREVNYYRYHRPDRAEYSWAKPSSIGGMGPSAVEHYVDYQELRVLMEAGTPKLSVGTEVPLRWLDP